MTGDALLDRISVDRQVAFGTPTLGGPGSGWVCSWACSPMVRRSRRSWATTPSWWRPTSERVSRSAPGSRCGRGSPT